MADDASLVAAVLEREAAVLDEVLDAVAAVAGPETWQGPAADQFNAALDERRRRLRAVADDLRLAARRQLVAAPSGPVGPLAAAAPFGAGPFGAPGVAGAGPGLPIGLAGLTVPHASRVS